MPLSRNWEMKRTEKKADSATLLTVVWWSTKEPGPLTVFKTVQSHCFFEEGGKIWT